MAGIQEILTLLLIIIAILFLPKFFRKKEPRKSIRKRRRPLSGGLRLALVATILVPLASALYLRPWDGNPLLFIAIGVIPVAAAWALFWVFSGFKTSGSD